MGEPAERPLAEGGRVFPEGPRGRRMRRAGHGPCYRWPTLGLPQGGLRARRRAGSDPPVGGPPRRTLHLPLARSDPAAEGRPIRPQGIGRHRPSVDDGVGQVPEVLRSFRRGRGRAAPFGGFVRPPPEDAHPQLPELARGSPRVLRVVSAGWPGLSAAAFVGSADPHHAPLDDEPLGNLRGRGCDSRRRLRRGMGFRPGSVEEIRHPACPEMGCGVPRQPGFPPDRHRPPGQHGGHGGLQAEHHRSLGLDRTARPSEGRRLCPCRNRNAG